MLTKISQFKDDVREEFIDGLCKISLYGNPEAQSSKYYCIPQIQRLHGNIFLCIRCALSLSFGKYCCLHELYAWVSYKSFIFI